MNVILQPAAGKAAREHYSSTIERAVPLDRIREFVSPSQLEELTRIYPDGQAIVWGVVESQQSKWLRIQPGDVVLFTRENRVFSSARLTTKLRNPALAKNLWGMDAGGRTWEYVYFVAGLEDRDIPYSDLNRWAGYSPKFIPQGFQVLDLTRSADILEALGFTARDDEAKSEVSNGQIGEVEFIPREVYRRADIHARYGGQQQGGISTPADHPIVLCFSGEQGEQYGYRDSWENDGVFLYTGEGQRGDMEFVRGNKAVLDHLADGKDLHLFEYVQGGRVQYFGEMSCIGFERRQSQDIDGKMRSAIIFQLMPRENLRERTEPDHVFDQDLDATSLEELRQLALVASRESKPPRESVQTALYRSAAVKRYVLRRAAGVCEACESAAPFFTPEGFPYLECHHIHRLSDGGPDHPKAVAALCPNCHRRAHYSADRITFRDRLAAHIQARED